MPAHIIATELSASGLGLKSLGSLACCSSGLRGLLTGAMKDAGVVARLLLASEGGRYTEARQVLRGWCGSDGDRLRVVAAALRDLPKEHSSIFVSEVRFMFDDVRKEGRRDQAVLLIDTFQEALLVHETHDLPLMAIDAIRHDDLVVAQVLLERFGNVVAARSAKRLYGTVSCAVFSSVDMMVLVLEHFGEFLKAHDPHGLIAPMCSAAIYGRTATMALLLDRFWETLVLRGHASSLQGAMKIAATRGHADITAMLAERFGALVLA